MLNPENPPLQPSTEDTDKSEDELPQKEQIMDELKRCFLEAPDQDPLEKFEEISEKIPSIYDFFDEGEFQAEIREMREEFVNKYIDDTVKKMAK